MGQCAANAQYCPVAKATEVLGDRWTLLIVREMLGGASGFNELQRGLPGISRSVLTDRMRGLERSEIVERRAGPSGRTLEYGLTPAGRDLEPVVSAPFISSLVDGTGLIIYFTLARAILQLGD